MSNTTLNSAANSTQKPKQGTAGQTVTKCCNKCGVELIVGVNIRPSRLRKYEYQCNACGKGKTPKHLQQPAPEFTPLRKVGECVYFISHDNGLEDWVKIGKTNDINQRIKGLATGSPYNYKVHKVVYTSDPFALETTLHQLFAHLRGRGEWFRVAGDLKTFITST